MKPVFVIVGAIVLLVDFFSYITKIDSSLLVGAGLAVAGSALLGLGFIRKNRRNWDFKQVRPQPIYHSVPKTLQPHSDLKIEGDRILRTVPDENAFYFYKMLHYYLDVRAKNLAEFIEKLKTIDVDSITFHVSRGDFREWFRTTLGDSDLARQVSSLAENESHGGEELRTKIANLVQTRMVSLKQL